jgi:hypothetical protein
MEPGLLFAILPLALLLFYAYVGWLILPFDLAKSFGRGMGFGVGLLLLGPVFAPILALGSAEYEGPAATEGGTAPATT